MRVLSIVATALFLTLAVSCAWAVSIDSTIQPLGHGKIQVTAADTYVFDRDSDTASTEFDQYNQGYSKIAVGLGDNVNLYAKLGAANMEINSITSNNLTTEEKYAYGFLYGGGISAAYQTEDGWLVGVDAQYNMWKSKLDSITVGGAKGTNLAGDLDNKEWQGTLYLGKSITIESPEIKLLPYIGAKYAQIESDYEGLSFDAGSTSYVGSGKLKNDNKFGALAGLNINFNDNLKLSVEGQFADELGATAGVSYKF